MGFGEALGALFGGGMAAESINEGKAAVGRTADAFSGAVAPFREFGASWLDEADINARRVAERAGTVKGYDEFMRDYTASPGAQYIMDQARETQNNSAAAKGKALSGGNLRALTSLTEGLSSTFANQAYGQYLAGDQQQFGQLQTALGDMFAAIGVGTTATGQLGSVATSQMGAQASLAKTEAENDRAIGKGFGGLFDGIGSLMAMF